VLCVQYNKQPLLIREHTSATPPGGTTPVFGRTTYFFGLVVFTCSGECVSVVLVLEIAPQVFWLRPY